MNRQNMLIDGLAARLLRRDRAAVSRLISFTLPLAASLQQYPAIMQQLPTFEEREWLTRALAVNQSITPFPILIHFTQLACCWGFFISLRCEPSEPPLR